MKLGGHCFFVQKMLEPLIYKEKIKKSSVKTLHYPINIGGVNMDIAQLSMVMSQSRIQQSAVVKMARDIGKETSTQMTEMIKNVEVDTNLGNHIDVGV